MGDSAGLDGEIPGDNSPEGKKLVTNLAKEDVVKETDKKDLSLLEPG